MDQFFIKFAGQGRARWHYGCTHAIIADIERSYIGSRGRSWLDDEGEARLHLILGPVNADGMVWFDLRELWQVMFAVTIFCTNVLGSFMLSFYTPTVGLGKSFCENCTLPYEQAGTYQRAYRLPYRRLYGIHLGFTFSIDNGGFRMVALRANQRYIKEAAQQDNPPQTESESLCCRLG